MNSIDQIFKKYGNYFQKIISTSPNAYGGYALRENDEHPIIKLMNSYGRNGDLLNENIEARKILQNPFKFNQ